MRALGKFLGRVLLALLMLFGALWLLVPEDGIDAEISFVERSLPQDLDEWIAEQEAQFSDIAPGTEKRIVWAGRPRERTPIAVVYLHGFVGSSEEMRPLPDRVAAALGANLYFTRFTGHGRGGASLGEAKAGDWLEDTAEALAIGRAIGDEVLVIAHSTGGTLAAVAMADARLSYRVKGVAFLSPNFRLRDPNAWVLTAPLARIWGPLLFGSEVVVAPVNEAHERFATTRYPVAAAFEMGALLAYARGLDYSGVTTPALFAFSLADEMVAANATRRTAARWGGAAELLPVALGPGDDPYGHILAGDIRSPGQTEAMVAAILDWVGRL